MIIFLYHRYNNVDQEGYNTDVEMNSDDSLEADISDEEEDAQQKPIQDDDPMEAVEDESF